MATRQRWARYDDLAGGVAADDHFARAKRMRRQHPFTGDEQECRLTLAPFIPLRRTSHARPFYHVQRYDAQGGFGP